MFVKRITCYEEKCIRIGNPQKNIIHIGNMVSGPQCNDMNQREYEILR